MYCVYMHVSKVDGRKYIGMTNDTKRRWNPTGREYKSAKLFYSEIMRIGFDNFEHIILEDNLTEEEARKREKYFIKEYNTRDPEIGFNTDPGGNGGKVYKEHPRNRLGKKPPDFVIEMKREQMSRPETNPMKNGQVIWGVTHDHPRGMQGKHHTEEKKRQIQKTVVDKQLNCKPVKIIFPDGKVRRFRSTKEAQAIGLTKPVILKIIRSGKPYEVKIVNQYTERVKHLEGIRIEYDEKIPR